MVKKQRNNLEIFRPFLDLQEFLKNRGLMLETSDFDFCDLLDELFHMGDMIWLENIFSEKIKFSKVILNSHMIRLFTYILLRIYWAVKVAVNFDTNNFISHQLLNLRFLSARDRHRIDQQPKCLGLLGTRVEGTVPGISEFEFLS